MAEYKERDIDDLDDNGDHYTRHINAMTEENLHSKMSIAAELAYRDCKIQRMEGALKDALIFPEWVETLALTVYDIRKHELKDGADRSIDRINKVLSDTLED